MKCFLRAAGLMLGLLLATMLHAQSLWPGTTAGMRLEEVKKAFPDAHEPYTAAELPSGKGKALLELEETEIAGHKFKVLFFFKEEQLVHVALSETAQTPLRDFEKFRDLLRAKYGLENATTSSDFIEVYWKVSRAVIMLKWQPLNRGLATLSITYEAPIPSGTDRL